MEYDELQEGKERGGEGGGSLHERPQTTDCRDEQTMSQSKTESGRAMQLPLLPNSMDFEQMDI